jgi:hypothetical protein
VLTNKSSPSIDRKTWAGAVAEPSVSKSTIVDRGVDSCSDAQKRRGAGLPRVRSAAPYKCRAISLPFGLLLMAKHLLRSKAYLIKALDETKPLQ